MELQGRRAQLIAYDRAGLRKAQTSHAKGRGKNRRENVEKSWRTPRYVLRPGMRQLHQKLRIRFCVKTARSRFSSKRLTKTAKQQAKTWCERSAYAH